MTWLVITDVNIYGFKTGNRHMKTNCDGIEKRVRLEVERMILPLRQDLSEDGPIISRV